MKKNSTIKEAVEAVKNREVSAVELVGRYLETAKNKNGEINAYLEIFDDANARAAEIDEKISEGEDAGELAGIPFAIKDNILIKDKTSSAGSRMLENYTAVYDAAAVEKLRAAGAVFLGRTNMDEFAMGSSTENSAFGPTRNPRDSERVPGGSSGGSAAAVAMDGALAALGSDTGGSIRQPAGFCGVVGLKPTYGAVSRRGLIAMASSLDQIGPITKTVEDAEIVFNVIKGKDKMDSTSVESKNPKSEIENPKQNRNQKLKIGVLKYDRGGVGEETNEALDSSVEKLRESGCEIKEIELPNLKHSLSCYYIIMPAEASANLARFDGVRYGLSEQGKDLLGDYMETRARGFGKEVKRRIMLGTYVLSAGYYDAYYGRAQKVRALIRMDFEKAFGGEGGVDAIIMPTAPTPAFKFGEKTADPLQMYLSDVFTVSANLAGVPAISVPVSDGKDGLPIGIQLIAPWFREDVLFKVGKRLQP